MNVMFVQPMKRMKFSDQVITGLVAQGVNVAEVGKRMLHGQFGTVRSVVRDHKELRYGKVICDQRIVART